MFLRYNFGRSLSDATRVVARPLLCFGLAIVFVTSVFAGAGLAQKDVQNTAADTSSPRDTLRSFIDACNAIFRLVEKEKYLDPDDPETAAIALRMLD